LLTGGPANDRIRYGYAPQQEKLDPLYPLSAYDVAEMGAYRRFRWPGFFRRKRHAELVERCLSDCGALDFASRPFSELSSGQKQRVLIARALCAGPEILILDEPLSGIDVSTQQALLGLFGELRKNPDLTVIMVSHRLQAEKRLFTHIAWLEAGRLESGPADEMTAGKMAEIFRSEP
jgi:ABC-type Mn2+/Zn2+ transport system ATPase subunit